MPTRIKKSRRKLRRAGIPVSGKSKIYGKLPPTGSRSLNGHPPIYLQYLIAGGDGRFAGMSFMKERAARSVGKVKAARQKRGILSKLRRKFNMRRNG